jgi:hypothetical protein
MSLHLLQVRLSNSISLLDLVNLFARIQKDPRFGPTLKSLFVIDSEALLVNFVPAAIGKLFQRMQDSKGPSKWAIVASDANQKSIFASALHDVVHQQIKIQLFEDEFLALQWLKSN